jgi:N-acyl-D-amino-acid deacylase
VTGTHVTEDLRAVDASPATGQRMPVQHRSRRTAVEVDLLIRNGTVVDGSGEAARPADVAVNGDRTVAIGELDAVTAEREIDASGKIVSPGFIDVHVHSEAQLADPANETRYGSVLQGVTTHLTAPDGFGWAGVHREGARQLWQSMQFANGETDLALDWPTPNDYLGIFQGTSPVNIVPQVPHCAVRYGAMGWAPRPATDEELELMRVSTRAWLEAGAVALSLGLDYQPSAFADTRELVELSKVAREYGAIYAAHVRYNDIGREAAWRETMEIGERARIPVHISHESVTPVTAPLLEEAAARCDLTFESYLYPAGCTHLALTLPIWAQAGGPDGIRERLKDPDARARIRCHLAQRLERVAGADRPVFVHTQTGRYIGTSIHEAAAGAGISVSDFAMTVLEEEHPYALMVYHRGTTPEEQRRAAWDTIRHPSMMVASDGLYHGQSAHPRGYGTFAQVLRTSVRETGAISLEAAVRKMSAVPAERFRIPDRGLLREGYGADIVIFDAETVADRATWDEPRLEPVGITDVIVNGTPVVRDGALTGQLPGRVLGR